MLLRDNFIDVLNKVLLHPNLKKEESNRLSQIIKDKNKLPEKISADILVEKLNLTSIENVTNENGYFKEFINTIDKGMEEESCTEIFYLMKQNQVSCLHKLDTTETWRWLGGNHVSLFVFSEKEVKEISLNEKNATFIIEKNTLFGAKNNKLTENGDFFGWVSCLCKPGFTFERYENPTRDELAKLRNNFPQYKAIIDELTPDHLKKNTSVNGSSLFTTLKTVSDKLNINTFHSACSVS